MAMTPATPGASTTTAVPTTPATAAAASASFSSSLEGSPQSFASPLIAAAQMLKLKTPTTTQLEGKMFIPLQMSDVVSAKEEGHEVPYTPRNRTPRHFSSPTNDEAWTPLELDCLEYVPLVLLWFCNGGSCGGFACCRVGCHGDDMNRMKERVSNSVCMCVAHVHRILQSRFRSQPPSPIPLMMPVPRIVGKRKRLEAEFSAC